MYALSILSAVLAMKTKETAFTAPIAIAMYEFMFFTGKRKKRLLGLVPILLTMAVIPVTMISLSGSGIDVLGGTGASVVSVPDYLATEARVIVTYLRLLLFPVNQNLLYDYPLSHSFWEPRVIVSFVFLASILGLGVYMLRRSYGGGRIESFDGGRSAARLAAFGVFWFFLALSVESGVVPLEAINEHRLYLPSAGAFMALVTGAFMVFEGAGDRRKLRAGAVLSVLVIAMLVTAAITRNNVWKTDIGLWGDVVKKSPRNAKAHNNLGSQYKQYGSADKAIEHYRKAVELNPDYADAHYNLANEYNDRGKTEKAAVHFSTAVMIRPDYAEAHNNLGVAYSSLGRTDSAIEHYRRAVELNPDYADAHYNLANEYKAKGRSDKAIEHFRAAINLRPDHFEAYNNLGVVYRAKGFNNKAIEQYLTAIRLRPEYAETHNNLGVAYWSMGFIEKAMERFRLAVELRPDFAEAHYNLALAFDYKGLKGKATEHYIAASILRAK
jgi:tetratricopeptide (TPR) repeat protein